MLRSVSRYQDVWKIFASEYLHCLIEAEIAGTLFCSSADEQWLLQRHRRFWRQQVQHNYLPMIWYQITEFCQSDVVVVCNCLMFRRSDWRYVRDTTTGYHRCHCRLQPCECVSEPWTAAASWGGTDDLSVLWHSSTVRLILVCGFASRSDCVPHVFTLRISCL